MSLNYKRYPMRPETRKIWKNRIFQLLTIIGWMIAGHILFSFFPTLWFKGQLINLWDSLDSSILIYMAAGFIAQMIDGSLGMAYGVSATSFLMATGMTPAAASASVHASEIFTSGVSGLSHLTFGNVNKKLFRYLLLPGVIGAIAGAYLVSSLEDYNEYIRPLVAAYTLYLGIRILLKVAAKRQKKKPIKRLGLLAGAGGFLDSIGGGGWGPIVSSTLIANGRNPVYTIGSVNLTEFFVSFASSLTFIFVMGFGHWQIILGLILGGIVAAPIAAFMVRKIPVKPMFIFVGTVIIIISLRTFMLALGIF